MAVNGFLATGRVESFLAVVLDQDTLVVDNTELYDNSPATKTKDLRIERERVFHSTDNDSIDLLASYLSPSWKTTVPDSQSMHRSSLNASANANVKESIRTPDVAPVLALTLAEYPKSVLEEYDLKFTLKVDDRDVISILQELPYENNAIPAVIMKMFDDLQLEKEEASFDSLIDVAIVLVPASETLDHTLEIDFMPWLCRSTVATTKLFTDTVLDKKYTLSVLNSDKEKAMTTEYRLNASVPMDSEDLLLARQNLIEMVEEKNTQDAQGDFIMLERMKKDIYRLESNRDIQNTDSQFPKIPFSFLDGDYILSKYIVCADENDMHAVFVVMVKNRHEDQKWNMKNWGGKLPLSLSKWIDSVKGNI